MPLISMGPDPKAPKFVADAGWLRPPNGWTLGEISAVAIDKHDNVWVLHRPRTIPAADQAHAAPPVLAFDHEGKFLRAFGGPAAGYDWPTTEHSLAIDHRGRVWIAGNFRGTGSPGDDMLLTFTADGRFVKQIGHRGASTGDADTHNLHAPADIYVDNAKHEVFVADGYVNRRVIVFDSETGSYKRMWSAFGAVPPLDPAPPARIDSPPANPDVGNGPAGFNGVHGVRISRDGLVYVCDRNNQRIQVFTRSGSYLRQVFVDRNMPSGITASGIAFSADPAQRYLYTADYGNSRLLVFERSSLRLIETIGGPGTGAGQFEGPHLLATDSHGAVYVAEVKGRRLQRFMPAK